MKRYRSTSHEAYTEVLPTLSERTLEVLQVFIEHPDSTVEETLNIYMEKTQRYLARNEYAKLVSHLFCEKGHLVSSGERACKISGRNVMIFRPCEGKPVKPKKETFGMKIKRLEERIIYLETILNNHKIPYNSRYESSTGQQSFY